MRANLYRKKIDKKIYAAVFFAALLYICFLFFERVYPNYIARVDIYMDNAANAAINSALAQTMKKESFENFGNSESDSDGKITLVEGDTYAMNLFKAKYTENLYKIVNETEPGYVVMPLGSLLKNEIFSGMGPMIRIKTQINGIIKCDFADSFESCGINQVRHKIYLDVSVNFCAVSAAMNRSRTVKTTVPVSETIISGTVPKYYGAAGAIYGERE